MKAATPNPTLMFDVKWQKLCVSAAIWFVAEMSLGYLGIDTLADYSEFLVSRSSSILVVKA